MLTVWIILGFILISVYGKWILLFLSFPLIRIDSKRNRKKASIIHYQDILSKKGEQNLSPSSPLNKKLSGLKRILSFIYVYFNGFERFILLRVGYIPSHHIRDFIYKRVFLVKMGRRSVIYYGAELRGAYNIILGNGSIIGDKSVLDARRGYIKIGENVQLGNNVSLWTGSHDYNDPFFRSMPKKRGPIEIEDYVWIGPGATVLHSVKIGKGAVIGAGAIVTKDVEPFTIMAGIPAKKVGERSKDLKYELGKSHIPFY